MYSPPRLILLTNGARQARAYISFHNCRRCGSIVLPALLGNPIRANNFLNRVVFKHGMLFGMPKTVVNENANRLKLTSSIAEIGDPVFSSLRSPMGLLAWNNELRPNARTDNINKRCKRPIEKMSPLGIVVYDPSWGRSGNTRRWPAAFSFGLRKKGYFSKEQNFRYLSPPSALATPDR